MDKKDSDNIIEQGDEHMSVRQPEAKTFSNRESVQDFLGAFANPEAKVIAKEQGDCTVCIDERAVGQSESEFRNPGSFILDYADGTLTFDLIKKHITESNITTITSHDSCGAAVLVYYSLMQSDKLIEKKVLDFLNDGEQKPIQLKEILSSDDLGKLWSNKLARVCGLEYSHLEVDAPEHYASIAIVDIVGLFKGDTLKSGAFVVHPYSSEAISEDAVVDIAAAHAVLSAKIARSGHSVLGESDAFWIPIVIANDADQREMAAKIQEKIEMSGSSLNIQVEIFTEDDFSPDR